MFASVFRSHSDTDAEQEPESGVQWPPVFESYAAHKAELDEAIKSHPDFGVWLRQYRNIEHVLSIDGGRNEPMWSLSVEQLKQRYVTIKTVQERTKNAKRAFAEMHLEENAEAYQAAQDDFAAKEKAYQFAYDQYVSAARHGYKTRAPRKPEKEYHSLLAKCERLEEIVKAD